MTTFFLIRVSDSFRFVPSSVLSNHIPCDVVGCLTLSLDDVYSLSISDLSDIANIFNNLSHD